MSSFHGCYRVKLYQGVPCVACLNLKTYGVIILSLFLRLVVVVGILMNKILIFSDFHIYAIATFWAMSLVGIYPGHFLLLAKLNNKIAWVVSIFKMEIHFKGRKEQRKFVTSLPVACLGVWFPVH